MIIIKINRQSNKFCTILLLLFLTNLWKSEAFGMPGGPTQQDYIGLTPINNTEMVDKFTGKFNYNIPLMTIGDCPVNISYDANVTGGLEASWVGLGWTLNPGSINRIKRGIPDDFRGDIMKREVSRKPIVKYSGTLSGSYKSDFNIWKNSWKFNALYDSELGWGTEVRKNRTVTVTAAVPLVVIPGLSAGFSNMNSWDRKASTFSNVTTTTASSFSIGLIYYAGGFGYMNSKSSTVNSRYGLLYNTSYSGLYLGLLANSMKFHASTVQSFIDPSYNPSANIPYHISSTYTDEKDGAFVLGFARGTWEDSYSSIQMFNPDQKILNHKSYGYLHSSSASDKDNVIMDVNREKDIPYHSSIPYLSIPSHTFDLFLLNQHENGGQFRAYNNGIGFVKDPEFKTTTSSKSRAGEGFYGTFIEEGMNFQRGHSTTVGSSGINYSADVYRNINFQNKITGNTVQENIYFKKTDELEEIDPSFNSTLLDQDAMSLQLTSTNSISDRFINNVTNKTSKYIEPVSKYYGMEKAFNKRPNNRSTYIVNRDFDTKKLLSVDPEIYSYNKIFDNSTDNTFNYQEKSIPNLVDYNNVKHQIAEFNVTNSDGKIYNYGIPIYNLNQEDVVFSSKESKSKDENGLVEYNAIDASINNANGKDYYYNKEITPKYAHSWLLTSVSTPDYYDVTNNGATVDDVGDITKINYTNFGKYSWRTPMDPKLNKDNIVPKALMNEGIEFETNDNKGIYSYGEREEWYTHSIESKTQIAFFILEDRADAYPTNQEGNLILSGMSKKQRLKKIVLYSKADIGKILAENPASNMNAIIGLALPIKTIEFLHSYKLCPNSPDNLNNYNKQATNTGKLTLDEIRVYQGKNSNLYSCYKFDYSANNPAYNITKNDKWGCYKPDIDNNLFSPNQNLENSIFPYSIQNKSKANENSSAWLLTKITIPSGGSIKIDYESNTYGYVQNKRAATMYKIIGTGNSPNQEFGKDVLYSSISSFNDYLFFETNSGSGITNLNVRDLFFEDFNNMDMKKYLYYEAYFTLTGNKKQLIPGYLEIEDIGLCSNKYNSKQIVWVKVKNYDSYNPMAVNAWQYVRDRLPDIAYEGYIRDFDRVKFAQSMLSNFMKIYTGEEKFEVQAIRRNIAKTIDVSGRSWLRALIPNNTKYGGGTRVAKLTLSDEWNKLVNPNNTSSIKTPERGEYEIDYEYDLAKPCNENDKARTSGVATYEPLIGGSENPWRMPVFYKGQGGPEGPSSMYNLEKPFGEMLFPSASIGYSRIKESKNKNKIPDLQTSDGFKVYEFYTAKDFPLSTNHTELQPGITQKKEERLSDDGFDLLNVIGINTTSTYMRQAAAQGYSVILNDMHGKIKSDFYFKHGQCDNEAPLNYTIYDYKPTLNLASIDQIGNITNKNLAENIDATIDKRTITTTSSSSSEQPGGGGTVGVMLPPFKVWVSLGGMTTSIDEQYMNFISTSKIYHNNHILNKVSVKKDGAIYSTENILWDSKTQNVVLSSTTNEFGQIYYNYQPPAYWAYPYLSHAYENRGVKINLSTTAGSTFMIDPSNGELSGIQDVLKNGDECLLTYIIGGNKIQPKKMHVFSQALLVNSIYKLLDDNGNEFIPLGGITNYELIVKSGSKNILHAPLMSITSIENPVTGNSLKTSLNNVLNASAYSYKEEWPYLVKNNFTNTSSSISSFNGINNNPFIVGNFGNLKIANTKNVTSNRKSLSGAGETPDVRQDGFSSYNNSNTRLLYIPDGTSKFKLNPNASNWDNKVLNTLYDKNGNLLETLCLISRLRKCKVPNDVGGTVEVDCCINDSIFNSTKYGYLGLLPIMTATNAKYNELDFISFEENHFSLPNVTSSVNDNLYDRILPKYTTTTSPALDNKAHTGKYSLKLAGTNPEILSLNCIESIIAPSNGSNKGQHNYKYLYNLYKGQTYKLNLWIKSTSSLNSINPNIVSLEFKDNTNVPITITPPITGTIKTPLIEGWQLFEINFDIPSNASTIKIRLKSGGSGEVRYIDDLKLTPINSNSRSYVYNQKTMRLISELDENHFTTFYDYNESGNLIRLRKETEKGIITLKEVNSNIQKP